MAQVIARVESIEGKFFAKDVEGNSVELHKGDTITEGMIVFGDAKNSSSAQLEMSREDGGENIILLANQEQSFDASMAEESMFEEALSSESVEVALLNEPTLDETAHVADEATKEEKTDEEDETDAGDKKIKEDEAGAEFAARDGNAVDVNSDLRDAKFLSRSHTFEIKDRFLSEAEDGLNRIDRPSNTLVTPPAPITPITPPTPPAPTPTPTPTPPPVQIVTPEVRINDVTIDEVNGVMRFTVTSSSPAGSDITFSYKTVESEAKEGSDFQATNGTGTIRAGESSTTITVPIVDDFYAEDTETFKVNITTISPNATIADGQGVGTILDNGTNATPPSEPDNPNSPNTSNGYDSEDTVYVKLTTDATANEGDDLVHGIKLVDADGNDVLLKDGESVTVTLTYTPDATDGATQGVDYTAQTTVTITGTATGNNSAVITNPTLDDIFTENSEGYTISVGSITDNANSFENILDEGSTVSGTIVDDNGTAFKETVQIVLIALDENNDPVLDGSGNYTFANNVNEDSAANYKALAFSSTETVFNATTQISLQLGSVVVSSVDTASATANTDYTPATQTIALDTPFSIDTLDDNLADSGETYNVKIDSYVAPTTGTTYESTIVNTQQVTTTILDNSNNTPLTPYDETGVPPVETDLDTITIKLFAISEVDGSRVAVNNVNEGSTAEYIAVAFDKAGNEVLAGETVEVTFGAVGDSATAGGVDYTSTTQTVTLGTKFNTPTTDDFMADNAETYKVQITDNSLSHATDYETVVIDTTSVTTTILDDTGTPNTPNDGVESNHEAVIIKLVACDASGAPILVDDGNGNITQYTFANNAQEGSVAQYMAVAFAPNETLFTTNTEITPNGTVAVTFSDGTATGASTQGATIDGSKDYDNDGQTVSIGTAFSTDIFDDYLKEGAHDYTVTITSGSYTPPSATTGYENVTESGSVVTTIYDDESGSGDKVPNEAIDSVYVKLTHSDTQIEGNNLTHTVTLVDKDGTALIVPVGETITVTIEYTPAVTDGATSPADYTATTTVTITAGNSSVNITNPTIDDFTAESTESYTAAITNVTQANETYENIEISTINSVTGTIEDGVSIGTPVDSSVDEDNFVVTNANSTITDTQSLDIIAPTGENAYTLSFDGTPTFTSDNGAYTALTSNGTVIEYVVNGATTTAYAGAGRATSDRVFVVTLNKHNAGGSDDDYTYTQYKNIDHPTTNVDDNVVLTFGFKVTDGAVSSPVESFNVTVNDSLPSSANQDLTLDEDGSKIIVISNESFAGGSIILNNGDGDTVVTNGNSINIYDADKNDVVGTLTNNGDGTLTFNPYGNYSGATDGFTYSVSDSDGDTATGTISLTVTPKSDAATITDGGASTIEDTAVVINLKAPVVSDNTDQNESGGATIQDAPELLGLISLDNMTSGVSILKGADDSVLWTSTGTTSKLYILLSDGTHTQDDIDAFGVDANHITMTTAEFEALKVNPVAQAHNDIDIKMHVTEYEVNDSGYKLADADVVGTNGSTTNKTFHVEVEAVTDSISLTFDSDIINTVDVGTINDATHFTHNALTEGVNSIDLKQLLTSTTGNSVDMDGSEYRSYIISGVPEGTVVVFGDKSATANASGELTITPSWNNDTNDDVAFTMTLPEQYSGTVNATITLSVTDTDSDTVESVTTETATVYFNVEVTPVADIATLQVAQAVGFEDAGRSGGNTDAKDGTIDDVANGIPLEIKATSDDKDGSETFNVKISDIPTGAVIYYDGSEVSQSPAGTITISNFDNAKSLTFIPPHNSDADYVLKVNAQTVDGADTSAWLTADKDLQVTIKDVADAPVGTDLNVDGNGYSYTNVESTLDSGTNSFDLKDVYVDSTQLNSYDSDSETLSIVISGLTEGLSVTGASPIGNGVWTVLATDINNVKIITPANFSGEADFDLKYVTTEAAGDSKTHYTDNVKIFVSPSAEATINAVTTADEDVLQKVDFGIVYQNGDSNETLQEVRIKASDVDTQEFTLYIGNSTGTPLSTLTTVGGYYVLDATQAGNIYAKNTTEHTYGDYNFEVQYTVRDTEISTNSFNETDGTLSYNLKINAVTDAPSIALGTIDDSDVNVTVSGTNITVSAEDTTFTVPVNTTSLDQDGSEGVTKIIITGVPMGVEVVGATYYGYAGSIHNGIWVLTPSGDTATKLDVDGALSNIAFTVHQGADFAQRDMTITTYTKDAGSAQELSASTTIHIEKTYTSTGPGTGTPPQFMLGEIPATIYEDDTDYNLGESLTVTNVGGGVSGQYAITITDFPAGTTVSGASYSYEENGVMRYVVTGNGNAADAMAKLSAVVVTPPADLNDSDNTTKSMTFTATVATQDSGTFYDGNTINYEESILPVTDDMTIAIATNDTLEDTATNFTITLSNDADGVNTKLVDNKVYITITENYEGGESTLGSLVYGGLTLIKDGNGQYVIDLPVGYQMGDVLNFTFHPGDNRNGNVTIDAIVKNYEGEEWSPYDTASKDSTATATINVAPVVDGFNQDDVKDSTIDEATGTDINIVKLDLSAQLSDPSESMLSATIDKVPNGFIIYYGTDANNLQMATNTGLSGTDTFIINPNGDNIAVGYNQWLVPLTGGELPAYIALQAPQNWSGTISEVTLNLFGISDGGATTSETHTFDVIFNAVADGLTIDPTLTFGDAFSWVDLKLNANMVDVDGSEKMYLEISGLDDMAQFRLADGTSLETEATFDNGTSKWTIAGIDYDQINNIQLAHDTSVTSVSVDAWTVESANSDASTPAVTGVFDLTLSNVSGTLALDEGVNLDFNKLDGLSTLDNVNTIDLSSGDHSIIGLALSDVVDMTDSNNELTIIGDTGDNVSTIDTAGWTKTTDSNNGDGTHTYNYSKDGSSDSITLTINDQIDSTGM